MKVILASGNKHKAEELNKLLSPEFSLKPAPQKVEVAETGSSFSENAFLKAKAYFEKFNTLTLADDSGLNLEDFPDLLGVQSARFKPELTDYQQKCQEILKLYKSNKDLQRKAYFSCVLCLYLSHEEYFFFEGRCHGSVSEQLMGEEGFGYDPIFIPDGHENHTFATDPNWKEENGHRAKAIKALKAFTSSG